MNIQIIEKSAVDKESLDVHSIFTTLQGEGPFVGQPCVFVRLAGCNLQCPLCDTDYTSTRKAYTPRVLLSAVERAMPRWSDLIILTGGEPFRQRIRPFIDLALDEGYRVQIETNGSLFQMLDYTHPGLTVVCSPKTGKLSSLLIQYIAAYKYVVRADQVSPDDHLPLRVLDHSVSGMVARPPTGFDRGRIYVQPCDDADLAKNEENLKVAIQSCFANGYTLGLQVHKIINQP